MVQGVGFRPFIYRLANKNNLLGTVANRTDGVVIKIKGEVNQIKCFKSDIMEHAPVAATIKSISEIDVDDFESSDFRILSSVEVNNTVTEISPDIAVCKDCLDDMKSQFHRVAYPFINCTNCGPRFSIVKKLPYDRVNTTMHE